MVKSQQRVLAIINKAWNKQKEQQKASSDKPDTNRAERISLLQDVVHLGNW